MEKTTKPKEKSVKYGHATKTGMETLFKKPQAEAAESLKAKRKARDEMQPDHGGIEEANALGGPFAVCDPIPTIVGPIGRFQATNDAFPLHPAVALFGKRRTGKTFTLRDIMEKCFKDIPFGIVLTRTKTNGFWQQYVPPNFVFQDLQKHVLDRLVERQRGLIAKWKKDNPEKCKDNPDAYKEVPELAAFVILDDVVSDQNAMRYNADLLSLFVEGRHMCISVFITTQHVKGVGPMIRGNCDLAIFQPIFQREARETLADLYGGWMERKDFYALMDDIVVDENLPGSTPQEPKKRVRTMFVNDFENTLNPQIKFRYYEAEDPGPFHLCHKDYWNESMQTFAQNSKRVQELDIVEELETCRYN